MALQGSRDESYQVNHQMVQSDVQTLTKAARNLGTDEITILSVLITRSFAHLAALAPAYQQATGRPLSSMISSEFSGHMKDGLLFIARGMERGREVRAAEMLEEVSHSTLLDFLNKTSETDVFLPHTGFLGISEHEGSRNQGRTIDLACRPRTLEPRRMGWCQESIPRNLWQESCR